MAPSLGATCRYDPTHADSKAETATLAMAEAAAWSVNQKISAREWLALLSRLGKDEKWTDICSKLTTALSSGRSVSEFTDELGLQRGVTGYAYHPVPVALYA